MKHADDNAELDELIDSVSDDTGTLVIKRDAMNRAERTFWQGLFVTVLISVTVTVQTMFTGMDNETFLKPETWMLLGTLLAKDALVAVTSYVLRRVEH